MARPFEIQLGQNRLHRNVRELQNLIKRSVILSTSAVLSGSLPELPHPR
jgi:transcriptional regulator with AAA-type ATPase domain